MSNANISPELLTPAEAGRLCSLSARTLARYSATGRAPRPVKLGDGPRGAVRYPRQHLVDWISAGCPHVDGNGEDRE